MANQNQKNKIRTIYILELLPTECSTKEAIKLLPSRSTWNFKNTWLLYINVGHIMTNQNQKTKIRALYILKMLYTGCSTKEATSLLLSRNTQNIKKNWFLLMQFRLIVANQIKKTKFRTLYILRLRYTECSTKEAIKLLSWRNTWNFKNN